MSGDARSIIYGSLRSLKITLTHLNPREPNTVMCNFQFSYMSFLKEKSRGQKSIIYKSEEIH
jgi:hypothetical protein